MFSSTFVISTILTTIHLLGMVAAVKAIMRTRTSQGAIAWAVALLALPEVSLPLYWILGRSKFHGYVAARRMGDEELEEVVELMRSLADGVILASGEETRQLQPLERLAGMPFSRYNHVELLVDGQASFEAIFAGIDRDDRIGREFRDRLVAAGGRGVRVFFLYDEIGSHALPADYLESLRAAGVEVRPFHTTKGKRNRFQINFRNHRKIVVVDGTEAYVGGHNVGDEYMGRSKRFGHWRDTHVKLQGPAVMGAQLSFAEDWYWAAHDVPDMRWEPSRAPEGPQGDMNVLVIPSGPADNLETCTLSFLHVIASARRRLWLASPYFVPDQQIISALQLAALRGVDVRIMLPQKPDHLLVYLSSFSYLPEAEAAGVKVFRYQPGFLHQKVLLKDDDLAWVGTANVDNRSFRLNFEITVAVADKTFARGVEAMLQEDFARCRQANVADLANRPFLFKVLAQVARLMAPLQ